MMPICPACQFENDDQTALCRRCGRVLDSIIRVISTRKLTDPPTTDLIRYSPAPEGMNQLITQVKLAVSGHDKSIPLDEKKEDVILGRTSGVGEAPTVDLTEFGAYMQGVSRHHASIKIHTNICTIQDLGSANGTWVNQQRLPAYLPYPLKAGDEITLGQLRIVVDIQTMC